MDKLIVEKLEITACHGCNAEEKVTPQKFLVSFWAELDFAPAAKTDDLTKTVHYGHLMKRISAFCENNCFNLIETLAEGVAREILLFAEPNGEHFIQSVRVKIEKPEAPVSFSFASLGAEVTRSWHKVALSLGSNLGKREANLSGAVAALRARQEIRVLRVSQTMETEPFECALKQDKYLNCAVLVETLLSPFDLLDETNDIEIEFGREGKGCRAARTLDIDLVFYDDLVLRTPKLTLPHADMHRRRFVLEPLFELVPNFVHPVLKKSVSELLSGLDG